MKLSDHFRLEEFTYSRVAIDNGIDNSPSSGAIENLKQLVKYVIQPLRDHYGKPIHITSGYRCQEVNRLVRGVSNSQHLTGCAADLWIPEGPRLLLDISLETDIPFGQAILYRVKKILHLSYLHNGRNLRNVCIR